MCSQAHYSQRVPNHVLEHKLALSAVASDANRTQMTFIRDFVSAAEHNCARSWGSAAEASVQFDDHSKSFTYLFLITSSLGRWDPREARLCNYETFPQVNTQVN